MARVHCCQGAATRRTAGRSQRRCDQLPGGMPLRVLGGVSMPSERNPAMRRRHIPRSLNVSLQATSGVLAGSGSNAAALKVVA